MGKISDVVSRWSRRVHNYRYKDYDQTLCARAWLFEDSYLFWKIWTYVFIRRHCRRSWEKWRK